MPVDEKYIEEVEFEEKEEMSFDDVLNEFGIEASHQNDNSNGLDLDGYTVTSLKEMWDSEEYIGRPIVTDVYTVEFKNKNSGETTINHKIDLVLLDDAYEDEKEAYIFPINLNSDNIDFEKHIVKNVSNQSGLYALAMGLMELKAPKISKAFNHLDVVGIKKLQKQVENYKELTVRIVEKSFKRNGEETLYNSFKIVNGE